MNGAIICDLDGVLYLGEESVPGALHALEDFERRGAQLLFCTNNSTRTAAEAAAKIRRVVGFPARPDQVVTSAMAAAHLLAGQVDQAHVVGDAGVCEALEAVGIELVGAVDAPAVVVGLDRTVTYARIRDAALAVRAGARFVATNLDGSYPTPAGQWPGAGSLATAIAVASDRTPEVAGKPHRPMIDLLKQELGDQSDVVVIGDRPETDLALGREAGWRTVLVLTGVTGDPTEVRAEYRPDAAVDSIAGVPDLLTNEFQWEVMGPEPPDQTRP
ncbi:MAG: HAD-IIA family hydrolase [Acidimicrobiia bacterium]|nr:HAD-IIA family hydrolase [Acidimicrobiia bacterium]